MERTYYSKYSPDEIMWIFTILSNCTKERNRTFTDKTSGKIINTKMIKDENEGLHISVSKSYLGQTKGITTTRCYLRHIPNGSGSKIIATSKRPSLDVIIMHIATIAIASLFAIAGGWCWILSSVLLLMEAYSLVSYNRTTARELDYIFNDLIYQVYTGSKQDILYR